MPLEELLCARGGDSAELDCDWPLRSSSGAAASKCSLIAQLQTGEYSIEDLQRWTRQLSSDSQLRHLLAADSASASGQMPRVSAALECINLRTQKVRSQIWQASADYSALQERLATLESAKRRRGELALAAFSEASAASTAAAVREQLHTARQREEFLACSTASAASSAVPGGKLERLRREVRLTGSAVRKLTMRCKFLEAELATDAVCVQERAPAALESFAAASASCSRGANSSKLSSGCDTDEDSVSGVREASRIADALNSQMASERRRHHDEVLLLHAEIQRLRATPSFALSAAVLPIAASVPASPGGGDWV